MSKAPIIEVEGLTLTLSARHRSGASKSDAGAANGAVGGSIVRDNSGAHTIEVLNDVSFSIERGQSVGLIGLNGSGKSSMLRLLGGIYPPTSGRCVVHGQVTTLFSNQLGMIPQASAIENIRTMATLMGIDGDKIPDLIKDVVEFSELGDYVNLPVKTYSSGMRVRIGFGVATSVEPDVLLIDEIFGTGDHSFVQNARRRLNKMIDRSGAIIMAGHSNALLKQYCTHAIWLDRGRMKAFGPIDDVLEQFRSHIAKLGGPTRPAVDSEESASA